MVMTNLTYDNLGEYGPLKHSLDYTELSLELGLFCCLFIERHIFWEHYDIQNI